jgi:hypothetical protein
MRHNGARPRWASAVAATVGGLEGKWGRENMQRVSGVSNTLPNL